MQYTEDDMLMLSGIQHYAFCPRQWALIHIEQKWQENLLTVEGQIMHQHVDDPFYRQKMGANVCLRSVHIASRELGLYGISDIIELYPSDSSENAISHPEYPGWWLPCPVEYKHGKPKRDNIDAVQLCAQAMCLEEMYGVHILEGEIFYGEVRRREVVSFDDALRDDVREYAIAMHSMFDSHNLPRAVRKPCCRSCSMVDECMPDRQSVTSVHDYLKMNLYEETT